MLKSGSAVPRSTKKMFKFIRDIAICEQSMATSRVKNMSSSAYAAKRPEQMNSRRWKAPSGSLSLPGTENIFGLTVRVSFGSAPVLVFVCLSVYSRNSVPSATGL